MSNEIKEWDEFTCPCCDKQTEWKRIEEDDGIGCDCRWTAWHLKCPECGGTFWAEWKMVEPTVYAD